MDEKRFEDLEKSDLEKISKSLWNKSTKTYKRNSGKYKKNIKDLNSPTKEINEKLKKIKKNYKKVIFINCRIDFIQVTIKDIKKSCNRMKDMYKDAMKYREYHSKVVAEIAMKLLDNTDKWLKDVNLDINCYERNVLYLACLTHDIRKFHKKHHDKGAKWFKDNVVLENSLAINDVYILIKNHNIKITIKKKINYTMKILILILRLSDKLSKFDEYSTFEEVTKQIKWVCKKSKKCIPKIYQEDIEKFSKAIYSSIYENSILDNVQEVAITDI